MFCFVACLSLFIDWCLVLLNWGCNCLCLWVRVLFWFYILCVFANLLVGLWASCWWIFDLRLVFGLGLLLVDLVCVFWFDCFGEPLWAVLVCVVPLVIVFDFIVSDVGLDFG